MQLQSRNKIDVTFNMASMTDIVFLLLVFFMLTSSFVTPSGVSINLPSSKASKIEIQKVSITITEQLDYYIDDQPIAKQKIEDALKERLFEPNGVVTLHLDKTVPTEEFVYVAGLAISLKAKVSIVTKPHE